ncbi:MAG TPA: S-layer homology domain-containing protein [Chthonomonadaceae bacterium]|nr:S-layer homology domain-containing protein [Chthonomonadaceae bacterium]
MRRNGFPVLFTLCALALPTLASAQGLPSDVRSNHWAVPAVQAVLKNNVMSVSSDKGFHGEAKVTHQEAVLALAKLARALENNTWQRNHSAPVPDKVAQTLSKDDWKTQPLTRFALASILARFGDYAAAGLSRPGPGAKELGKSIALPGKATITAPHTNPAYASLTYLAENHMIWPKSPLLTADDKPVQGEEMSQALMEMITGLNNKFTELGHDENGSTIDNSFHNKPGKNTPNKK